MASKAMDISREEAARFAVLNDKQQTVLLYWQSLLRVETPDPEGSEVEQKTERIKKLYTDFWNLLNTSSQAELLYVWNRIDHKYHDIAMDRAKYESDGKRYKCGPEWYHYQNRTLANKKNVVYRGFLAWTECVLISIAKHYKLKVEDVSDFVWEQKPPKEGEPSLGEPDRIELWNRIAKPDHWHPGTSAEPEIHGFHAMNSYLIARNAIPVPK